MKHPLNLAGSQIAKIRNELGVTQEMLAARCEAQGLTFSRSTLAKIETRRRCLTDIELVALARALRVKMQVFFPTNSALF